MSRLVELVDAPSERAVSTCCSPECEPLLRNDFAAVYRTARRGALVTVFTNGTLVSDEHVALFRELPPTVVDVSLYGATPRIYEAGDGRRRVRIDRCLVGVRRLLAGGVPTALKTVILRRTCTR